MRLILFALLCMGEAVPASAAPCLLCGESAASATSSAAGSEGEEPLRIEIATQLDFSRI
ncbi:MAG: resolvase, partial [Sphingopyxis sp.]|nr:resolvase [Sphingopyxis sp.]